ESGRRRATAGLSRTTSAILVWDNDASSVYSIERKRSHRSEGLSMRRFLWLLPILGVVIAGGLFVYRPAASAPKADSLPPAAAALPLRTAVLFSSGVGYFQRRGEIEGNARVDLTFQVKDINDLIKSMVVQDDKGQVGAISYDSLDP